MAAKQLLFQDEARQRILRGIDTLAQAVCVTLGPRGRTVILERDFGPPQIVNSGVLVAKSVELEDRFENMGAQLLREVFHFHPLALEDAFRSRERPKVDVYAPRLLRADGEGDAAPPFVVGACGPPGRPVLLLDLCALLTARARGG